MKPEIRKLLAALKKLYPEARTALDYQNPLQLLVATILSAQCTDVRVNQVTPALFARFPTAADFAAASLTEIEKYIASCGFFRNKAKSIHGACTRIVADFAGEVPSTLDELITLPGIGRKSANVILGDAFGVPGITVDTHVGRLSRRLGLTAERDPVKVEFALMDLIPKKDWIGFNHRLIYHGRQVCHSRRPQCADCTLATFCPQVGIDDPAAEGSEDS